jgi:hypothetical protein
VSLTKAASLYRSLDIRNLSDDHLRIAAKVTFRDESDQSVGVSVQAPGELVTVSPGGNARVPLAFDLDPGAMRPWTLRPAAGADAALVDEQEVDGWVTLGAMLPDGSADPSIPSASVPFYVLARRASDIQSRGLPAAALGDGLTMEFVNRSRFPGAVELLIAPPRSDTLEGDEDPDESDVGYELDIRRVGVRIEPPTETVTRTMITFGIARHEMAAIPQVTRFEVYLDVDRDGSPDHRIREVARGDRMQTWFGAWDPIEGSVLGEEAMTDTLHTTDLHTHLTMLSLPTASVSLTDTLGFGFYVVSRGLTEDWLMSPKVDVAPDGALDEGGPTYLYEPGELARTPAAWHIDVDGLGAASVELASRSGSREPSFLAFYPDNRFEDPSRQLQALTPGVLGPPIGAIFLPYSARP